MLHVVNAAHGKRCVPMVETRSLQQNAAKFASPLLNACSLWQRLLYRGECCSPQKNQDVLVLSTELVVLRVGHRNVSNARWFMNICLCRGTSAPLILLILALGILSLDWRAFFPLWKEALTPCIVLHVYCTSVSWLDNATCSKFLSKQDLPTATHNTVHTFQDWWAGNSSP